MFSEEGFGPCSSQSSMIKHYSISIFFILPIFSPVTLMIFWPLLVFYICAWFSEAGYAMQSTIQYIFSLSDSIFFLATLINKKITEGTLIITHLKGCCTGLQCMYFIPEGNFGTSFQKSPPPLLTSATYYFITCHLTPCELKLLF